MQSILTRLRNSAEDAWEECRNWLKKEPCRRNELAVEAAEDHLGKSEDILATYLRNQDRVEVIAELLRYRKHARCWSSRYSQWVRQGLEFDNAYAERVHAEACDRYRDVMKEIEYMGGLDLFPPAKSKVSLLVPITRCGAACRLVVDISESTIKVFKNTSGEQSNEEGGGVTGQLLAEVKGSIRMQLELDIEAADTYEDLEKIP